MSAVTLWLSLVAFPRPSWIFDASIHWKRSSSVTVSTGWESSSDAHLQLEAMAFIVGWHSRTVLLRETRHKHNIFTAIGMYLQVLGVHLERGVEYYLSDPARDGGLRAQEFVEQTYKQLSATDLEIANHFGIATNVLLTIAHCKCDRSVPPTIRSELSGLAEQLDVPAGLQKAPRVNLLAWAGRIERYFESLLKTVSSSPRSQALGISPLRREKERQEDGGLQFLSQSRGRAGRRDGIMPNGVE